MLRSWRHWRLSPVRRSPGEWSPRIGLSWDPTKDGRSKIYGHYGRYYEKIPLDMAVRVFSGESGITQADYYDRQLTSPIQ